jgi:uncharacterized damage-inducible protein DinB
MRRMNVEDFRLLYEYNLWANHRTLDACSALNDDQFTRDLKSSFPSVRDTLVHLFLVEWIWLERWHGRSPAAFPSASDFPNLDSVRRRWDEIERDLTDYIASLTPDDLARVIHHKTMKGDPQSATHWQMLQHVVNHQTYHRGQVATMLRQLGGKAISTDLIFFYRERVSRAKA